jgi:hypothetical protein
MSEEAICRDCGHAVSAHTDERGCTEEGVRYSSFFDTRGITRECLCHRTPEEAAS